MDQWDPALKDKGGDSLYGAMCLRVAAAGGKVKGVLWYQGESDTSSAEAAAAYPGKFARFVKALRRDLAAPKLPFYYVQLGRVIFEAPESTTWDAVQVAQLLAESELGHCGMVAAIDLQMDDFIHVGRDALRTLGVRLANLALRDCYGKMSLQAGPRLASVTAHDSPHGFGKEIIVRFRGVNSALCAAGRVSGFSISGVDGKTIPTLFEQALDPSKPDTIVLSVGDLPQGAQLWYGRGLDPYCNVTDELGMALPVFGPVPIQ